MLKIPPVSTGILNFVDLFPHGWKSLYIYLCIYLYEGPEMQKQPDLELRHLEQFNGTDIYYRHMGILLTDGVRYLMENGYSWFVTDAIITIKLHPKIRRYLQEEDFLTIELKLTSEYEADMIITDGNDNELYRQHYDLTDAKRELKLFYTGNVLMLAQEY
jgi:hypothetical protein